MNKDTDTRVRDRNRGTPEGEGSSVNLMNGLAEPRRTDVGGPHAHRHSHPRKRRRRRNQDLMADSTTYAADRALRNFEDRGSPQTVEGSS